MTTDTGQGDSRSVELRGCIAASITLRDACQGAISGEQGSASGGGRASLVALLREAVTSCERATDEMRSGGDGAQGAMESARDIAGRVMRTIVEQFPGDDQLAACAEAARACASACLEAASPDVPYDKVVADTFPGSDPPAH